MPVNSIYCGITAILALLAGYLGFHVTGLADTVAAKAFCEVLPLQITESPLQQWRAEVSYSNCNTGHPHQWYSYLTLIDKISGKRYSALMVVKGHHEPLAVDWLADGQLHVSGVPANERVHFEQPIIREISLVLSPQ
ncbi:hypothetical protein PY479_04030 [Shewanella sp. A32]|uniref:hypothetical protein n=1 Tax=Shewanella sp. A32 TaxID=3031327 RepID=UPI0023B9978B|nr:hypothetical protein [Shewanella sp. A32]MDF0533448.1 hypothetical protein [Shewanella sp. A32]